MAIHELTSEQIQKMTLEQKDKWWLDNIYRGNEPQLTWRSAITGMLLGGILSLTNLYVGIRTGWTLGVGITSVVLAYAIFKALSKMQIGKEIGLLENNAMQSIATSAGYMTMPLVSSIPAYMIVTHRVIPMGQAMLWMIVLSILGVLFAFPLKKRFINDEQLPFPEGYAAGVVMDNLHAEEAKGKESREGILKAKLLLGAGLISAVIEVMRSEKVMNTIKLKFLTLPDSWDDILYKFVTPAIMGTPLNKLTVSIDSSIVMMGTGGLMGPSAAFSMLLGAVINFMILAPILIKAGIIHGASFKLIVMWSVWGGVSLMTTASLYSFFSKPEIILGAFSSLFKKKKSSSKDPLRNIELPSSVSMIGIPIVGLFSVWIGHHFFGVHYLLGLVAIPLVFVFTLIAVYSTGMTSITPGSALGKLTQLTYGALAPGNIPTNIMTAGITSEVSLNASNLLMDIKPGYMLGGKPRHQAIGHVLGIFAGAFVCIPVFYTIFNGNIGLFTSDKLPMPSAQVWVAVAEILAKGFGFLDTTARWAILIGGVLGIVIEVIKQKTKGKFAISAMGLGLAFVLPFKDSLSFAIGAFVFWYAEKLLKNKASATGTKGRWLKIMTKDRETICAGIIAGGSIVGIILIMLETIVMR